MNVQTDSLLYNQSLALSSVDATGPSIVLSKLNGASVVTQTLDVSTSQSTRFTSTLSDSPTLIIKEPMTTTADDTAPALHVQGETHIDKSLQCFGPVLVNSSLDVHGPSSALGVATFTNSAESTSTVTGAVVISSGGLGLAGNLTMGGSLNVSSDAFLYGNANVAGQLVLQNDSVTLGGASISKSVTVGGQLSVGGVGLFNNGIQITDSSPTALVVSGGISTAQGINIGGESTFANSVTINKELSVAGRFTTGGVSFSDKNGILHLRSPTPGVRIAANNANKSEVYRSSLSLFTLGNALTDPHHESLQISSTGQDTYSIITRSGGKGTQRKLQLYAGNSNAGQVTLNSDGTVNYPLDCRISNDVSPLYPLGGTINVEKGDVLLGGKLFFCNDREEYIGGPPTVGVRSPGARLVLQPALTTTTTDFAFGIDQSDLWYTSLGSHVWYNGDIETMRLNADGSLKLSGQLVFDNTHTNQLTISNAASETIRLSSQSPNDSVGIVFANNEQFLPTEQDGDIWYVGKNVLNSGERTFAIGTSTKVEETDEEESFVQSHVKLSIDERGVVTIPCNVQSTSVENGALVVNGGVGVGGNCRIGGNLLCNGKISSLSDQRYKTDVTEIVQPAVLDKVRQIKCVEYTDTNGERCVGVIAQQLEKIFPKLVHVSEPNSILSVDYSKLSVYLIVALQELCSQLADANALV